MTEQAQLNGDDRDAHVVEEICGYVTASPPQSFFLFAGAGSGKNRTLVEVLRRVTGVVEHVAGGVYAKRLRSRGQTIRVVTYTKNATNVVMGRLGDNQLTSVSTIHAFCWELIQGFDADIKEACLALKNEELAEVKQAAAKKKNGETAADFTKYTEIAKECDEIRTSFFLGMLCFCSRRLYLFEQRGLEFPPNRCLFSRDDAPCVIPVA